MSKKIRFSLNAGDMVIQCKILDFLPRQVRDCISGKRQAFELNHRRTFENANREELKGDQISEAWKLLDQNMLLLLDHSDVSPLMQLRPTYVVSHT